MSGAGSLPPHSPFGRLLGAEVEDLPDGSVELRLSLDERHTNELGFVHGGVAAALLDGAMGRALSRRLDLSAGESCATVHLSVQYLAPPGDRLVVRGRVVREGGRVAFLEGEAYGADGRIAARAVGTWSIRRARRS